MQIIAIAVGVNLAISAAPAVAALPATGNQQPHLAPEAQPGSVENREQENLLDPSAGEAHSDIKNNLEMDDSLDAAGEAPEPESDIPDEEAPSEGGTAALGDKVTGRMEVPSDAQPTLEESPPRPEISSFIGRPVPPPLGSVAVNYGRWTKKNKVSLRSSNSSSSSVVTTIPTSGKKVKVSLVRGAWSRVKYGSKSGWVVTDSNLTNDNARSFLVYGTLRYKKSNWRHVSNAEARQSMKIKGHALYNVKFGKQAYGATTASSSKTVVADQLSFKAADWTTTLARVDSLEFNLKVQSGSSLVRFYQRNKATASDGTKSWSYPVSSAAGAKAHLKKHGTTIKSGDLFA